MHGVFSCARRNEKFQFRKILTAYMLTLCLLLGCVSFAAAEQMQDEAAVHGVDAVVVLDMTNSMRTETDGKLRGNDIYGYRMDATAMLIGMLDMNGSRVAIVPFAGTPLEVTGLTSVDTLHDRRLLINKINRNSRTLANTNIGAALMRANQILAERDDTKNQPMIVLLTDGENTIGKDVSARVAPSYRWNAASQTIEKKDTETFSTEMANAVTLEAVECAKAYGYPIYTVALNTDPTKEPLGGISLNNISLETGVTMGAQQANADTADQLPEFFANILADKIGSSVQMTMQPVNVGGSMYEVPIPIVNNSVQETNIIIPVLNRKDKSTEKRSTSQIESSSIRVLNGDRETGEPTVTVLYENGFFAMIKIKNPKMDGIWKLRFESAEDPSAISFNLLYNYDIKLATSVTNANASQEFYKNDTLRIEARFVDAAGNPSPDSDLYRDHTDIVGEKYKSWAKIDAAYSLFRTEENGRMSDVPLISEALAPNDVQNMFSLEKNLLDFTPRLKAGKYVMRVTTVGAGLARQVDIPLEIRNHEPVAETYEETIRVNPVGSDERWSSASTSERLAKSLSEIVKDEDQDEMAYDLQPVNSETAEMALEGGYIRFTTREEINKVKAGDAEYQLFYNDGELAQPKSARILLHVVSDVDEMLASYTPEIKILDPEDGDREKAEFLKNNPLKISVRLRGNNGQYAAEDLMQKITGTVRILKDGTGWREDQLTLNGDALEYTTRTENTKADLTAQVELKYFGQLPDAAVTVKGGNAPVAAVRDTLVINREGEGVPGFLRGMIGENTPEDDPGLRLDLKELFTDEDRDELEFGKPEIVAPGTGEAVSSLEARPADGEENVYQITYVNRTTSLFHYSYDCAVRATATDGDGETGTFEQKITVVDLYNKMMTQLVLILIGLAILAVVILIIHQIRKPKFPMLNLTIREEPSLYESGSNTLSPVKTPTNLNQMGVEQEMAAKHNISVELLQNTIVKPLRSINSVGVCFRKQIPGHDIMLDDTPLKLKKWYTWRIGQELTVRSANGEGLISVKLEDRRDMDSDNDMTDFGNENEWTATGFDDAGAGEKQRTHRVSRKKAAPKQEEKPQGGSTDDFDF